jgi:tetratricopeptide (TPR) repeat protein
MLVSCLLSAPSFAGEILACFKQGVLGSCSKPALQHVPFKSVVLQFVDPGKTGLGESLSRLLWREILESISDLGGAGVILAYDREGEIENALGQENVGNFLEREYHAAANAIAEQQKVQMAIWGAVLQDGNEIFLQPFLTLRNEGDDAWSTLSLSMDSTPDVRISALLGRNRLNLAPLRGTRAELFGRNRVTRCALDAGCPRGIELHDGPSNDSPVSVHVPVGSQVKIVDMRRQWLKVDRQNAPPAWINIYHVEMFPRIIEFFFLRDVNLRAEPGGDSLTLVDLDGTYDVIDTRRHGKFGEPWYFIEVGSRRGWVAGRLVNRRSYTFPTVHLIAGLYRYGRGQFSRAVDELQAFLSQSPDEDNVTRAAVLQFLAASRVAGHSSGSSKTLLALDDLDRAARLTPFDARVYSLRAVVQAGAQREIAKAVAELKQALELNRRDPGARQLLRDLSTVSENYGLSVFAPGTSIGDAENDLQTLKYEYLKLQ